MRRAYHHFPYQPVSKLQGKWSCFWWHMSYFWGKSASCPLWKLPQRGNPKQLLSTCSRWSPASPHLPWRRKLRVEDSIVDSHGKRFCSHIYLSICLSLSIYLSSYLILSVSFHFLSFAFSHFFRIDSQYKKHHEPEHHVIMKTWQAQTKYEVTLSPRQCKTLAKVNCKN